MPSGLAKLNFFDSECLYAVGSPVYGYFLDANNRTLEHGFTVNIRSYHSEQSDHYKAIEDVHLKKFLAVKFTNNKLNKIFEVELDYQLVAGDTIDLSIDSYLLKRIVPTSFDNAFMPTIDRDTYSVWNKIITRFY